MEKGLDSLKGLEPIELLEPKFEKGNSIKESLKQRKTIREISGKALSLQVLSNLLWAAYGVNRKKGPFNALGRTAASASNSQEIEIYVALKEGTYLYDATHNSLLPVVSEDLRKLAIGHGQEESVTDAPIQLIYVADISKLENTMGFQEPGLQNPEIQKSYYFVDTGLIAGNVYIFAASQGLAAWFHNCQKRKLAEKLKLSEGKKVLFAQTVGYPKK